MTTAPARSRLVGSSRRSALMFGCALGVAIWLLSPLIAGRREPWDAEGGYYVGALLIAGVLGGFVVPTHWVSIALGILVGQAVVLVGSAVVWPSSGGLWPLGLVFLAGYAVLGLLGAGIGMGLQRLLRRREGMGAG